MYEPEFKLALYFLIIDWLYDHNFTQNDIKMYSNCILDNWIKQAM